MAAGFCADGNKLLCAGLALLAMVASILALVLPAYFIGRLGINIICWGWGGEGDEEMDWKWIEWVGPGTFKYFPWIVDDVTQCSIKCDDIINCGGHGVATPTDNFYPDCQCKSCSPGYSGPSCSPVPASHGPASHGPASHGPASHGPASHGPATPGPPTRTCADTNADGAMVNYDCSAKTNEINTYVPLAWPAGVNCAGADCTVAECCTVAATECQGVFVGRTRPTENSDGQPIVWSDDDGGWSGSCAITPATNPDCENRYIANTPWQTPNLYHQCQIRPQEPNNICEMNTTQTCQKPATDNTFCDTDQEYFFDASDCADDSCIGPIHQTNEVCICPPGTSREVSLDPDTSAYKFECHTSATI